MAKGSPLGPAPTDIIGKARGAQGGGGRAAVFQMGGGAPGGAPGPGGSPSGSGTTLDVPPFHQVKPPQAKAFKFNVSATGLNAANTPAIIPGGTFQIPAQNVGVVRSLSVGINNMLTTSNITFSLRFDETPVPGWDNLVLFPRAATSVVAGWSPDETYEVTGEGVSVDILVNVLDAGTYQIGTSLSGWYYSKRLNQVLTDLYLF